MQGTSPAQLWGRAMGYRAVGVLWGPVCSPQLVDAWQGGAGQGRLQDRHFNQPRNSMNAQLSSLTGRVLDKEIASGDVYMWNRKYIASYHLELLSSLQC